MAHVLTSDDLLGMPLQMVLDAFHRSRAKKDFAHCKLYLNKLSGGIVLLTRGDEMPSDADAAKLSLVHFSSLTSYDLPTVHAVLSNDIMIAFLFDYILHELPPELPRLFHILLAEAMASAIDAASQRIQQLEDIETVRGNKMPLTGSLKKVLNYMAIQFNQGQYEFLNIIYNMKTGEYELMTPAELERFTNTGKMAERRHVLHCTIHELKKIVTTDQLRLDIPNAEEANAEASSNRQLDPRESTPGMVDSDESEAGRPGHDGLDTGPQPNHVEPTGH